MQLYLSTSRYYSSRFRWQILRVPFQRDQSTMASPHKFSVTVPRPSNDNRQRLATLKLEGYGPTQTPNLLAIASRGFVPHLTPDILLKEVPSLVVHFGFEDFADSVPDAPVHYDFPCKPTESPLRSFTCLPETSMLILGPRRAKPISSNGPNTYTSLNIVTSTGHREMEISYYLEAIQRSRPNIIIAPVDVEFGRPAPGRKRQEKIVERSTAWVRSFEAAIKRAKAGGQLPPAAFVPILPVDGEIQRTYLEHLQEKSSSIDGLVVYSESNIPDIPDSLQELPVLTMTDPQTPHDILRLVQLGVDLISAPFINTASEAGIAFDFSFWEVSDATNQPLGLDLWDEKFATDLKPLVEGCSCYACTNHHRAYIRHLLSVKEMLAWALLQIHNYNVMDRFFVGVKKGLASENFKEKAAAFALAYQPELPAFSGQGPRLRGYQASLGANPTKLNKSSYRKMGKETPISGTATPRVLNERKEKKLESQEAELPSPGVDATILEDLGFGQLYNKDEVNV